MTKQEREAIYDGMLYTIIEFTKKAKAAGFTGQQTWENLKGAIVEMTNVPESVAAFLIREAWAKAAE